MAYKRSYKPYSSLFKHFYLTKWSGLFWQTLALDIIWPLTFLSILIVRINPLNWQIKYEILGHILPQLLLYAIFGPFVSSILYLQKNQSCKLRANLCASNTMNRYTYQIATLLSVASIFSIIGALFSIISILPPYAYVYYCFTFPLQLSVLSGFLIGVFRNDKLRWFSVILLWSQSHIVFNPGSSMTSLSVCQASSVLITFLNINPFLSLKYVLGPLREQSSKFDAINDKVVNCNPIFMIYTYSFIISLLLFVTTLFVEINFSRYFMPANGQKKQRIPKFKPASPEFFPVETSKSEEAIFISDACKSNHLSYYLKNVDLTIPRGQIVAVCGQSGCGKSTLLSAIANRVTLDQGTVAIKKLNGDNYASVGYCPQTSEYDPRLTVRQNLELFGYLKSNEVSENGDSPGDEVEKVLKELNIIDKQDLYPDELDKCELRFYSIALAFVGRNDIVLLDEPTDGLSPSNKKLVWSLIQKRHKENRDACIIFSTKDLDEVDCVANKMALLEKGSLYAFAPVYYMKQHLGFGYNLTFEFDKKGDDNEEERAEQITDALLLVRIYFENARIVPIFNRTNFTIGLHSSFYKDEVKSRLLKLLDELSKKNGKNKKQLKYSINTANNFNYMLKEIFERNYTSDKTTNNQEIYITKYQCTEKKVTSSSSNVFTLLSKSMYYLSFKVKLIIFWAIMLRYCPTFEGPLISALIHNSPLFVAVSMLYSHSKFKDILLDRLFVAKGFTSRQLTIFCFIETTISWIIVFLCISWFKKLGSDLFVTILFLISTGLFTELIASNLTKYPNQPTNETTNHEMSKRFLIHLHGSPFWILIILDRLGAMTPNFHIINYIISEPNKIQLSALLPTALYMNYIKFNSEYNLTRTLKYCGYFTMQILLYSLLIEIANRENINILYCLKNYLKLLSSKVYTIVTGKGNNDDKHIFNLEVKEPPSEVIVNQEDNSSNKNQKKLQVELKKINSRPALEDISFEANENITIGILGPIGSGKTTLLSLIAGFIRQESGSLVTTYNDGDIGFGPDLRNTRNKCSPLSISLIISQLRGCNYNTEDIEDFFRRYEVSYHSYKSQLDSLPVNLKSKLSYLFACLANPNLVIIDEPANSKSMVLLSQLRLDKNLIIASNDWKLIEQLSDKILIISKGKLVADGSLHSLVESSYESNSKVIIKVRAFFQPNSDYKSDRDELMQCLLDKFNDVANVSLINNDGILSPRVCDVHLVGDQNNTYDSSSLTHLNVFKVLQDFKEKKYQALVYCVSDINLADIYDLKTTHINNNESL